MNLSEKDYRVLTFISSSEDAVGSGLLTAFLRTHDKRTTKATAYSVIKRLLKRQLLRVYFDTNDGSYKGYRLSRKGAKLWQFARAHYAKLAVLGDTTDNPA